MTGSWLHIEATRPIWLLGLLALPILFVYFRRGLVDLPDWQQWASLALRSLIIVLAVFALANVMLQETTLEQYVVFAVDRSLSIGDDSQKTADEYVSKALEHAGNHRVAFVDFAAQPAAVRTERSTTATKLDDRGTDLAAAVDVAAAAIPPFYVPKIVLLTDGNETAGDVRQAALRAKQRGVSMSIVPLPPRSDPEVQVSAVQAPAQVQQGEPFYVDVVIDSNHDDEGTIEIFRGPHRVVEEKKKLVKGENRFRFRQAIDADRLAMFTVQAKGFKDTLLDNNRDGGLVYAAGKPRVLLVEEDPKLAEHLSWALEEEGIAVDVRPPAGMPESLADMQNYELIAISNIPATALSMRTMEMIRSYVQDLGGGLMMIGGDQSFGLGGYYKTAIEEILPVRSDFEKEKEKPSLAMALVIDKSGSMGGEKIEMAKEAAKSAVDLLGAKDKIGVIAFDGDTYTVVEMTSAADRGLVNDRISTIEAGGGTTMYPAMEAAFETLQQTQAKLKHVIILTDGISSAGDFEGMAQQMAQARMTVTTVAIGSDSDENLLEEIARIGGGRHYMTDDPSSVPQIFAKETMEASKSAINEQPFVPQVVRPTQALGDIDFASAPFLLGYVVTRPKPTAEFVLASEAGDPLLVWWRYGLGMTVAFTSDAKPRWAAEWLGWPGFSKFWAQVVRHAMRKSEAKGSAVEILRKGEQFVVSLDSVDPLGRFINSADAELTVIDPQMNNRKLPMTQTAPGRYVANVPAPLKGAYHLEIVQKLDGQVLHRQSRGQMVGYPEELRLRPLDEQRLRSIAALAGGIYAPTPEAVFAPVEDPAIRVIPLWRHFIAAALTIFLLDVLLRRLDLSLWLRSRSPAFVSR